MHWRSLVASFLVLALAACAAKGPYTVELMPAPAIYQDGAVDPFSDLRPVRDAPPSRVLFATTRAPAPPDAAPRDRFYGDSRYWAVRLGEARVVAGDADITWEEAREISLLKNRTTDFPISIDSAREFGVLDSSVNLFSDPVLAGQDLARPRAAFAGAINRQLADSRVKDVFVYVHGFRTNFQSPQLVAAGLWHYLGYNGAFVTYNWPSTMGRFDYAGNAETADWAAPFLRMFIEFLAEDTQARRIHLIGYSAGTRVVARALEELTLIASGRSAAAVRAELRLGHVMLVGSDIDRGLFGTYLAEGLLGLPEHVTAYVSGSDKALGLSRWLFHRDRLGQAAREPLNPLLREFLAREDRLRIIDVTDAENARHGSGHEYLRASPWVSSDILSALMYDLSPTERGLVRDADDPIWRFPPDYMDQLIATVARRHDDLSAARKSVPAPSLE